ncbi:hypothetical protein Q9966_008014 [Columba livia]|nr:hypothetical protein Q9966_008014 [Columba livia]
MELFRPQETNHLPNGHGSGMQQQHNILERDTARTTVTQAARFEGTSCVKIIMTYYLNKRKQVNKAKLEGHNKDSNNVNILSFTDMHRSQETFSKVSQQSSKIWLIISTCKGRAQLNFYLNLKNEFSEVTLRSNPFFVIPLIINRGYDHHFSISRSPDLVLQKPKIVNLFKLIATLSAYYFQHLAEDTDFLDASLQYPVYKE